VRVGADQASIAWMSGVSARSVARGGGQYRGPPRLQPGGRGRAHLLLSRSH
jgi:hypothetical protein